MSQKAVLLENKTICFVPRSLCVKKWKRGSLITIPMFVCVSLHFKEKSIIFR